MKAKGSEYLSLAQVADLLGMTGSGRERRLRRLLQGRERATGESILVRGGDRPNSPFRTTLAALRQHCPELFSKKDEMVEQIAARMGQIEQQIQELIKRQDAIVKVVRDL